MNPEPYNFLILYPYISLLINIPASRKKGHRGELPRESLEDYGEDQSMAVADLSLLAIILAPKP